MASSPCTASDCPNLTVRPKAAPAPQLGDRERRPGWSRRRPSAAVAAVAGLPRLEVPVLVGERLLEPELAGMLVPVGVGGVGGPGHVRGQPLAVERPAALRRLVDACHPDA